MMLNTILSEAGSDDTILHIGPCSSFFDIDYKNFSANIIIVEPDPHRAQRISNELIGLENAKVLKRAALESGREPALTRYSFSRMDGFRESTPYLQKVFPGIRAVSKFTTPTIDAAELTGELPDKCNRQDILFIDVLGEEAALLRALEEAGALDRFATIIVRAMKRSCFVDAANASIMRDWLAERFFDKPTNIDDSDPDFPVLCFRRNDAAKKTVEQAQQVELYQKERDDARRGLDVSLRLQSMANADLSDLQDRFASLQAEKEKQDALLQQVTQRLVTASEVFRNMKGLEQDQHSAETPEKLKPRGDDD